MFIEREVSLWRRLVGAVSRIYRPELILQYTITAAAQFKGCTRQRIFQLIKDGRLQAEKIDGIWLVPETALNNITPSDKRGGRPSRIK